MILTRLVFSLYESKGAWRPQHGSHTNRSQNSMSTYNDEENSNLDEAREEALTEPEAPGQVLDPLAEPAGSRGTRREVTSEYDEEDARERPPEDGLNPDLPEDENPRPFAIHNLADELEDIPLGRDNSDEIVDDETADVTPESAAPENE